MAIGSKLKIDPQADIILLKITRVSCQRLLMHARGSEDILASNVPRLEPVHSGVILFTAIAVKPT